MSSGRGDDNGDLQTSGLMKWPSDPARLEELQYELAQLRPKPWVPPTGFTIGGCFVCFERDGDDGETDVGWAAAVTVQGSRMLASSVISGMATAPYLPGFLAAREGPLLEKAVRALAPAPDVLMVNATGRDHPRRTGLAFHLGWALDMPSVGITHRSFLASGKEPGPWSMSITPQFIGEEQVGWWVRTRSQARPVAVTPGWRIGLDTCLEVVREGTHRVRTPEPIRQARRLARTARVAEKP